MRRGPAAPGRVLCIGAAHWDLVGHAPLPLVRGDDVPGRLRRMPGGCAANVALALSRQGLQPVLLAAVGDDPEGEALTARLQAAGVDTSLLSRLPGRRTDAYLAIEDPAGLVAAVAEAATLAAAGPALLDALAGGPDDIPAVIDANLSPAQLAAVAANPALARAPLRLVPASPATAPRLVPLLGRPGAVLHLNRAEAGMLCAAAFPTAAAAAEALVARGAARALVTDGPSPAADATRGAPTLTAAPPPVAAPARVTGAGDAFLAAHLAAELAGAGRADALAVALAAAAAHVAGDPA